MTCLSNCEKTINIKTSVFPLHLTDWRNWQNRSWEIHPCSGIAATGGSCRRSHSNWWTGYCPTRPPRPQIQDNCCSPGMKLLSKILEQGLEQLGRVYKDSVTGETFTNFQVGNNLFAMFICHSVITLVTDSHPAGRTQELIFIFISGVVCTVSVLRIQFCFLAPWEWISTH